MHEKAINMFCMLGIIVLFGMILLKPEVLSKYSFFQRRELRHSGYENLWYRRKHLVSKVTTIVLTVEETVSTKISLLLFDFSNSTIITHMCNIYKHLN